MKNVPAAEQEKVFAALEKNPDFFQMIALEVQAKIKNGKDQNSAVMEVINNHKEEFGKVFGN